jgi:hypothetical protein
MQPTSSPQASVSPLDQLADIHLPSHLSGWPLAPGWWILFGIFILMLIGLLLWRRRKTQNAYRLIAQKELAAIYAAYEQSKDAAAYLQALSVLLRRTALTAYPKQFNASIKGTQWLQWLDSVCPTLNEKFSGALGQSLLVGSYQKNPDIDAAALQQLCAQWIKQHRNHRHTIRTNTKHNSTTKDNNTEANHV